MGERLRFAGALALLVSFVHGTATAQTLASADALQRWVADVRDHHPGRRDRAVLDIAALSYDNRRELNPAMNVFLAAVGGQTIGTRTEARRRIGELFLSVRENPGLGTFIRRAVILHTDTAVSASGMPPASADVPAAREPTMMIDGRSRRGFAQAPLPPPPSPPLLTNDRYVVNSDGRMVGVAGAEWNWPFARSLLDLVIAANREFAATWYHATASHMMATGDLGDLRAHLERAGAVLPDDPLVAFDRGCYAERLGLAGIQALKDDGDFSRAADQWRTVLPVEQQTDAEAERWFRRAIELDAARASEARVRLARLLEFRGRHEGAAAEIQAALAARPERTVEYYAHLVGGRAATAMSRYADALAHYRAASALYPGAQSARLGASHAGFMIGDLAATQAPLAQLRATNAAEDADPWWSYPLAAGRDVDALLSALRARAR